MEALAQLAAVVDDEQWVENNQGEVGGFGIKDWENRKSWVLLENPCHFHGDGLRKVVEHGMASWEPKYRILLSTLGPLRILQS